MIFPEKPIDTNELRCCKAQMRSNCSERSIRRWQAVVCMCLTYWSQCLWAGPGFGKSETGWCRCAAANPPYPGSVSSYCDRWGWSRPCFPPADRAWRHEPFVTSLIHHSSTAHHTKNTRMASHNACSTRRDDYTKHSEGTCCTWGSQKNQFFFCGA